MFDELKDKGFKIVIMSNSTKHRLNPFKDELAVDCAAFSLKPKKDRYIKIMDRFKYKHTEVAAIGDQLITDIYGANKLDITSVLVNPLSEHDYTVTLFNRLLEKFIYNQMAKKDVLIRGKYFE